MISKKPGRFDQPGHRVMGARVGCRNRAAEGGFVHLSVHNAARLASAEVLADQRKDPTTGFLLPAPCRFGSHGIRTARVRTDNASAYQSSRFAKTLRLRAIRPIFTRPDTPKTSGKAERFGQGPAARMGLRPWPAILQPTQRRPAAMA